MLDDEYALPMTDGEREKLRQRFDNYLQSKEPPTPTEDITAQRELVGSVLGGFAAGYNRMLIKLVLLELTTRGELRGYSGERLERLVNELFTAVAP